MLRPRKMSRVLVTGSVEHLKRAIGALHRAGSLHITDYTEQYEGFRIGSPMAGAAQHSEKLLKLRSASKVLGIENGSPGGEPRSSKWAQDRLDELIGMLDSEVAARERRRQQVEGSLRELEKRKEAVLPFSGLPLPFEAYRAYDSVAVITGTADTPFEEELRHVTDRYELFSGGPGGVFALFIDKNAADQAARVLARHGFSEVRAPQAGGMPAEVMAELEAQSGKKRAQLQQLGAELSLARDRFQDEILACSEELSVEVERSEAPLRFATTPRSFVVEGWVPSDELDATENALLSATGNRVYMERMDEKVWVEQDECARREPRAGPRATVKADTAAGVRNGGTAAPADRTGAGERGIEGYDPYECVPISLDNPRPVKPFEALTEMFSLPSYKEIDPTALVALVFPFFFGFMIGDAGYGALLILTGVIFRVKLKKWEGFPQIGWYIIVAGAVAFVLGLFLFGEAFGLPFHASPGGTESMDWQGLTGLDVPFRGTVQKLEASGLGTLMMFSVLAGVVHLSLGNILGAINERRHGWKHSAGKLGWLMVVLGFGMILFKFGEKTAMGAWMWSGPMGALSPSWDPGIGIVVPYASIVSLAAGTALAVWGEGGLALMEVLGALANILSYTRIAAIGVAKAAMAFAFNILLIPLVVSGNAGYMVLGWVFLVLCHMLVFVLGGLSAGIQALRLNLVEFFMKFYKGGGVKFNPFGYARRYTVEE